MDLMWSVAASEQTARYSHLWVVVGELSYCLIEWPGGVQPHL